MNSRAGSRAAPYQTLKLSPGARKRGRADERVRGRAGPTHDFGVPACSKIAGLARQTRPDAIFPGGRRTRPGVSLQPSSGNEAEVRRDVPNRRFCCTSTSETVRRRTRGAGEAPRNRPITVMGALLRPRKLNRRRRDKERRQRLIRPPFRHPERKRVGRAACHPDGAPQERSRRIPRGRNRRRIAQRERQR